MPPHVWHCAARWEGEPLQLIEVVFASKQQFSKSGLRVEAIVDILQLWAVGWMRER